MKSLNAKRKLAGLVGLLFTAIGPASCFLDWEPSAQTGKATITCAPEDPACTCSNAPACVVNCPGGGCQVFCGSNESCTVNCAGGSCNTQCNSAASCTVNCDLGSCTTLCKQGAPCTIKCPGGGCTTL